MRKKIYKVFDYFFFRQFLKVSSRFALTLFTETTSLLIKFDNKYQVIDDVMVPFYVMFYYYFILNDFLIFYSIYDDIIHRQIFTQDEI